MVALTVTSTTITKQFHVTAGFLVVAPQNGSRCLFGLLTPFPFSGIHQPESRTRCPVNISQVLTSELHDSLVPIYSQQSSTECVTACISNPSVRVVRPGAMASVGLRRAQPKPSTYYWIKKAVRELDLNLDFSDRDHAILNESTSSVEEEVSALTTNHS
ncbi:hypothetical protein ElyMa_004236300 [Elysia marginata]|uniref:Uncharacterized protein n=1 Tax=Elysia marginata TaxID=1093978 RepID=A0AAV4GRH9_9GAST|nr:hypothetical protein ElyMa_004236300 [Elysia marginata]